MPRPKRPRRPDSRIWAAALFALLPAAPAQAQANATIEQVRDGLYVITGIGGNIAVRVTDEGVVVVDTGSPGRFEEVERLVAFVTSEPIRHVVNTHLHPDHTGGNQQVSDDIELLAHSATFDLMLRRGLPAAPRTVFSDERAIQIGDVEVRAMYLGAGHTGGDVVAYFPDLRVVHVGDLLHEVAPFIDYEHGGSSAAWVATLDRLLELDFDVVIAGHGPVMGRSDVVAFRDQMETVRTRIRDMIRGGALRRHVGARIVSEDLTWTHYRSGGFMARSLSGLYAELAGELRR
jgi:glyoxylase-like metal-dependent hydrolase (beta-lactamase superfamily II)